MKLKHLHVPLLDFKYDQSTGEFTCYANVFDVVDHAKDRTVKGCFKKCIDEHMKAGTMPKMLWMHNPWELPVGTWVEMREDEKGLFMRGKLSKTTVGSDIEILAKDGALDSFSIGYYVTSEKYNRVKDCNDLLEVIVKEVSWVNFACNEASTLQEIKTHVEAGKMPSKAELREMLKTHDFLSKRMIDKITAAYSPADEKTELVETLAKSPLFN